MRPWSWLGLGLLSLAACGFEDPMTDDVLQLAVRSRASSAAAPPADTVSIVDVEVCSPAEERRSGLQATVRVSSGSWQVATAAGDSQQVTVKLGTDGCATPSFLVGDVASPVRIDAALGDFAVQHWLDLSPAPIGLISLTSTPLWLEPNEQNTAAISTVVRAESGGKPSQGTTVEFTVAAVEPEGAQALLVPSSAVLDANGTAIASLATAPEVVAVTVRATVHPPDRGALTPEPKSADLTLTTP